MNRQQIISDFQTWLKEDSKSKNTVNIYTRHTITFLNWLEERYKESDITSITSFDLREYQNYLNKTKKYKPTGIQQRMNSIFSYCKFLVSKKFIAHDPGANVKLIKTDKARKVPKIVSKNEMNTFLREVYKSQNLRNIAIIELFLATGIRAGEMIGLEIDDISITERKGTLYIREGKGSKPRELPLNKRARAAINDYLEVRPNEYSKLWIGQRGPLTQDALNKMIKRYAMRVNLENEIHPHMFRHYLARNLLRGKNKADIVTVSYILGHSDIRTVQIYTEPSMEDLENALEGLYDE